MTENIKKPKDVSIAKAKGRPMLTWVGKKPLARVRAYPAQAIERFDATAGGAVALLRQGTMVPMAKASQPADKPRTSPAFERLLNMGKRLLVVIEHNRGGANKDLARFASQIASLCDKWDR